MARPSREMAFPFHIGPDGGIAYHTDPAWIYVQRLHQLIMTHPGERVMLMDYGTPVRSMLFENADDIAAAELAMRVRRAIEVWEPEINVVEIRPKMGPTLGAVQVRVSFSVPPREEVFSTVVEVGGNIALEGPNA